MKIFAYKESEIDLNKQAFGCAVKIPLFNIVYNSLNKIKPEVEKLGFRFHHREDAYSFKSDSIPEVYRRVYNVSKLDDLNVKDLDSLRPRAAITVISLINDLELYNGKLERVLLNFYKNLSKSTSRYEIGKGHSITASHTKDQEFILMDYLNWKISDSGGEFFGVANNDTVQIIDPSSSPSSKTQVYIAFNNALNDLFLKGVTKPISIYPLYDSPTDILKEEMEKNIHKYAKEFGFNLIETEPLNKNMQLIGTTAVGLTTIKPPDNYGLRPGDEIYAHRNIGDLVFINAYRVKDQFEEEIGLYSEEIDRYMKKVLNIMKTPNLKVARVIKDHRPMMNELFDPERHISATRDISGEGIASFKELAEDSKVNIHIGDIPLHNRELIYNMMKELPLIPNATMGTAGAIIISGKPTVMNSVASHLRKRGYEPKKVGYVTKGNGEVIIDKKLEDLVNTIIPSEVYRTLFKFRNLEGGLYESS